jgi:hypothetical protein
MLGSSRLRPGRAGNEASYKTRKGEVGGYREHLSDEDVRFIDERVAGLGPVYGYGGYASNPGAARGNGP